MKIRKPGKCSLCQKRFNSEQSFKDHAASYHAKRAEEAEFQLIQPVQHGPEREWEFYHLSRGWPI